MTVSAVVPGIFLKGNVPLRTITDQNFNLDGPGKGTVAGYFCHRDGRADTVRSNSLGLPPTQRPGPVSQIRFGSVIRIRNIEMIGCETIDCEARNMIKSDEHRFATSCAGCHAAFALKGKDFS